MCMSPIRRGKSGFDWIWKIRSNLNWYWLGIWCSYQSAIQRSFTCSPSPNCFKVLHTVSTGDLQKVLSVCIAGHTKSWHILCIIFSSSPYQTWYRHTTLSFLLLHKYFLVLLCRDDSHNHNSGPISRTDEQSLLSRILHQTAQYVVFNWWSISHYCIWEQLAWQENLKYTSCIFEWLHRKYTVESRYFEPPKETKIGSKIWIV